MYIEDMETKVCAKCGEQRDLKGPCQTCVDATARLRRARNQAADPTAYRDRLMRHVTQLGDSYVAGTLGLRVPEASPKLIVMKREQLEIHRLLQALNRALKGREPMDNNVISPASSITTTGDARRLILETLAGLKTGAIAVDRGLAIAANMKVLNDSLSVEVNVAKVQLQAKAAGANFGKTLEMGKLLLG